MKTLNVFTDLYGDNKDELFDCNSRKHLEEYRCDVVEKHKEMFPNLSWRKPIEHYANNRMAFTQAWLTVALEVWLGFPDLFDIFKIFNMSGKEFNDLSKLVQREKKKFDNQRNKKFWNGEKIPFYKKDEFSDDGSYGTIELLDYSDVMSNDIDKPFTPRERMAIFKRDNFRCVVCGRSASEDNVKLQADHIYPRSKGGLSDWRKNGATLCQECNLGKSNQVFDISYREMIRARITSHALDAATAARLPSSFSAEVINPAMGQGATRRAQ